MTSQRFIEKAMVHLPTLLRVGRRLTRNEAAAEDLVQETIARALEKRAELRDAEHLKGWLLAVQRSVFLNSLRGLRPRLEVLQGGLGAEAPPPAPTGNLDHEIHEKGLTDELKAALDSLPEEWRHALWLREVEELSYAEIAEVVGCPIGTVRSRLARARQAAFEYLEKEKNRGVL